MPRSKSGRSTGRWCFRLGILPALAVGEAWFRPLLFRGDQTLSAGLGELLLGEFAVLVRIN
jgi:hypothetical protein